MYFRFYFSHNANQAQFNEIVLFTRLFLAAILCFIPLHFRNSGSATVNFTICHALKGQKFVS